MRDNRLPDANFQLQVGDNIQSGYFNLVSGNTGGETSALKDSSGTLVIHAHVHDGGLEDGIPRMVDKPVTYLKINGHSCSNPELFWKSEPRS